MSDRGKQEIAALSSHNLRSLLTAIVSFSSDAIVGKDLDGVVTFWNEAAEQIFGYTAGEMVGQSITRLIPPDRLEEESFILGQVRRGENLKQLETERLTRDGRLIPVQLTISPVRDPDGMVVGVYKIARDMSEPRRLYRELEQRESLLRSMLDTVPDGLIVIDKRGIVRSFSPASERMFGYTAEEIIGRNVSVLMPTPQAAAHDSYMERYLTTGERRIIGIGRIVVARRKDGSTFPMELQIGEALVPGSHFFTGFVRDLTERQDQDRRLAELQSELIHVSRLSELGQMVSALAHEVNQPLTAIANYISGIRRLLTDQNPPALHQAIARIAEQAERAHHIVQSLRGLVKKEAREQQVESLETMIQETSALALLGTGRSVHLDLHISRDARYAVVEKVQIQQVLLNLMRNAVEAMKDAPVRTLTVTTTRCGQQVQVQVADSGPGLPESVQARLFQPFVTTKPDGLGVGLSICRAIIEGHGGQLTAESNAGRGAIFRFTVPGAAEVDEPGDRDVPAD